MSAIETRIAKLEQITRDRSGSLHVPGVTDEQMVEIRRVAAVCANPDDLAAYLRTRLPAGDAGVVSLDDRRRIDAVLSAAARTIFEEVRS
ncbi:hypothetical protein [Sphingomonas endolithica]|uniref:hypothetical protein n=1 Tax=Sphingomonas endolithica TaxID=2972485 RepID=UPI0021AFF9B4|nr:hypothetical protein [Sphingomonas sp. ZFBP2030]